VLDWSGGEGYVRAQGERWHAKGSIDLQPGDVVRVERIEGLTLTVATTQGAPHASSD